MVENISLLPVPLELHLQGSLKLGVFFRSQFFTEKRYTDGDMKFMDITFEKLAQIVLGSRSNSF
jgi:hypothetical protein